MQCNAFEGHRPSEGQLCLLSPLSQHTHTHIQACMHTRECEWVKVTQLCLTLCDPVDYTVHGILQARILEWVTFPFSRGSSQPRDRTQVSALQADSLPAEPQEKLKNTGVGSLSFSRRFSQPRNWTEATESETTEESLRNYFQQWGKLTDWNSGPGGSGGSGGWEDPLEKG